MGSGETKRQTVQGHISRTYREIARQLEIIEALRKQGYPTDGAERRLANIKRDLQAHKAHLAQLLTPQEAQARESQPDSGS